MTNHTFAAMTSLGTRIVIATAAVVLSTMQFAGLADLAAADARLVMLDRVEIVGQRDLQPSVHVAHNAIGD